MISNYLNRYNYQIIWELKKKKKQIRHGKGRKRERKHQSQMVRFAVFFYIFKIKKKNTYFCLNWTNSGLFWPISNRIKPNRPVSGQIGNQKKRFAMARLHSASMHVKCGCATPRGTPILSRITHTQRILSQICNLQV